MTEGQATSAIILQACEYDILTLMVLLVFVIISLT